jgi:hypothetical protein
LRFVGRKGVKLREGPRVQPALCLGFTFYLGTCANVGEVLKDDGRASRSTLDKAFGEDMIVITTLAQQFATQLTKMSSSRFGALCLEFATKTEDTTFLLFPTTLTQKVTMGRDRTYTPVDGGFTLE